MVTAPITRAKIICTIGPASRSQDTLRALVDAGLNVARINFSHGTHEEHAAAFAAIRRVAAERNRPIAILGDLQGPRIRIGDLEAPVTVQEGEDVIFSPEGIERPGEIPITYAACADDVDVGDRILVDDGLVDLLVLDVEAPRVRARVVHGGMIRRNKGMNLPGVDVSAPSITEKDRADIDFAVSQGIDYLALSFVRRAEDIAALRALVPRYVLVVAKIEKDTALANIESILQAADAVMVARGDLGVELPFEEVPLAQKRIIALANALGRPVITATQMLESMVSNPRPTRAEASDVANAILDGTDAVMLSAETATGAYPRQAVSAMTRIIAEVEGSPIPRPATPDGRPQAGLVSTENVIAAATAAAARLLRTPAVIVFTKSGFTARIVASHRPQVPILALTDVARTYQQLALVWGVQPELVPPSANYDAMVEQGLQAALRRGLARRGDRIIVTAGIPFNVPGNTNLMKVEVV